MAIATLLIATLILKFTGATGAEGMASAIAIGSIICIVAAIAGDSSQDLKTGYILGATPKKQQYGEIVGVVASALAIGGTLYLLDSAWGFGSDELGAPQATLMKLIIEGVMGGNLPWNLVLVGVCIAIVVELIGIPSEKTLFIVVGPGEEVLDMLCAAAQGDTVLHIRAAILEELMPPVRVGIVHIGVAACSLVNHDPGALGIFDSIIDTSPELSHIFFRVGGIVLTVVCTEEKVIEIDGIVTAGLKVSRRCRLLPTHAAGDLNSGITVLGGSGLGCNKDNTERSTGSVDCCC
jgi:hypothetical protein